MTGTETSNLTDYAGHLPNNPQRFVISDCPLLFTENAPSPKGWRRVPLGQIPAGAVPVEGAVLEGAESPGAAVLLKRPWRPPLPNPF